MVTRSPGGRLTKVQATCRPDYLWSEVWLSMSKSSQQKERCHWAIETTARQCSKVERNLVHRSRGQGVQGQCTQKNRKCPLESAMPVIKLPVSLVRHQRPAAHKTILENKDTFVSLKPTNPRERAQERLNSENMKISLLRRTTIRWVMRILRTRMFLYTNQ